MGGWVAVLCVGGCGRVRVLPFPACVVLAGCLLACVCADGYCAGVFVLESFCRRPIRRSFSASRRACLPSFEYAFPTMGNKTSSFEQRSKAARGTMPSMEDVGMVADRALRFGRSEAGRHGAVLGVFFDSRRHEDLASSSFIVVSEFTIELFNPVTGDRRMRKTPDGNGIISCADFRDTSVFGKPVLLYGTRTGFVYFLDVDDLSMVKALKVDVLKPDATVRSTRANTEDEASGDIPLQVRSVSSDEGSAHAALESNTSWRRVRSGKGISSVLFVSDENVLVGGDDGRVHDFGLQYGGTTELYSTPSDGDFERSPVMGSVPIGESNLVVGHENGDIHVYARHNKDSSSAMTIRNGKWQQKLPNLSANSMDAIVGLGKFEAFATFDSGSHKTRIYNLKTRSARELNFTTMMRDKLRIPHAFPTAVAYDDEREMLFTGHMDGSFITRKVAINENELVSLKILRFAEAAHKRLKVPSAPGGRREVHAIPPTCITSVHYFGEDDSLFTGDFEGIARIKIPVTGIRSTRQKAVSTAGRRPPSGTAMPSVPEATPPSTMSLEETQAAADKIIAEMMGTIDGGSDDSSTGQTEASTTPVVTVSPESI